MTKATFLLPLALLAACSPGPFATLDEACPKHVGNAGAATDGAEEALQELSCWRRMAGRPKVQIDRSIQEAASAHTAYIRANQERIADELGTIVGPGVNISEERPTEPGFTGVDATDRLLVAGFPPTQSLVGELPWLGETDGPAAIIDAWMDDPYYRPLLLGSSPVGYGFAYDEALREDDLESIGWLTAVLYWPPGGRDLVTMPADGQQDVPLEWTPFGPGDDAIPDGDPIGWPLTLHVSDPLPNESVIDPYGMTVEISSFSGPEGEIDFEIVAPGDSSSGLLFDTAIVAPLAPLVADTDYDVTGTVTWAGRSEDIEIHFHTVTE